MPRLTKPTKQTTDILGQLASEQAVLVLRLLLDKHPELRADTATLAKDAPSSPASSGDIAEAVCLAVTGMDLDALNGRAGKHSWGYVEPSEAALELLQEAVEDWVVEMKQKLEADFVPAAQAVCVGIVAGLNKAESAKSEGVLDWAPDFAAEHASYIVEEFLDLCRDKMNKAEREQFLTTLTAHAPNWVEMFQRLQKDLAERQR